MYSNNFGIEFWDELKYVLEHIRGVMFVSCITIVFHFYLRCLNLNAKTNKFKIKFSKLFTFLQTINTWDVSANYFYVNKRTHKRKPKQAYFVFTY